MLSILREHFEQKRKARIALKDLEDMDYMGRFCTDYMHRRCYRRSARWAGRV